MVGQAQVGRQRLSLPRLEAIACRDRGGQRRHNLLAGAVIDGAVTACARLVGQTGNALLQKTCNPFAHRFAVHFEPKASALKLSTLSCAIAIAELTANAAGPTLGQVAA